MRKFFQSGNNFLVSLMLSTGNTFSFLFNLAETISVWKRPSTAGAQLSEAPTVEGEREGNPVQGKAHRAGNQDSKKQTQQKGHSPVSDPRRPPVKIRGPCWRDMPNEILIPLQSLISCFLEPPANRQAAGGTIKGLWRGYSSACPKGAIC